MDQARIAPIAGNVQQEPATSRWSTDRRKEAMGRAIAAQLAQGGRRVESQSDFNAVLVAGKPIRHVLHAVLTVLSLGFWAPVWIVLYFVGGEKREMVTVDEYGNTSVQKL